MRHHLTFPCAHDMLVGTIDPGDAGVGLLMVSGGNEPRSGAFAMAARLAAQIAGHGFPVWRYDRRGVGDSGGANLGFRHSGADIAAALAAFRQQCPGLGPIAAYGNCDAASALMLMGGAGFDALVLSNPWTFEDDQETALPPAAIRQRYARRLADPRAILRLIRGEIDLGKLASGLRTALSAAPAPSGLARQMAAGLGGFAGPARLLMASRDRTAQAFMAGWDKTDPRLLIRAGADHAFSAPDDQAWMLGHILATLRDLAQARRSA